MSKKITSTRFLTALTILAVTTSCGGGLSPIDNHPSPQSASAETGETPHGPATSAEGVANRERAPNTESRTSPSTETAAAQLPVEATPPERSGPMYGLGVEIVPAPRPTSVPPLPGLPSFSTQAVKAAPSGEVSAASARSIDAPWGPELDGLQQKLDFVENTLKSDLAALYSENLKLKRRLSNLERERTNLVARRPEKTSAKKARDRRPQPSVDTRQFTSRQGRSGSSSVEAEYKKAYTHFQSKRYSAAIPMFRRVMELDPEGNLADNAQYWIGECHFQLGSYQKAVESMAKVFEYEQSNKRADALIISGIAYQKMGLTAIAARQFRRLLTEFPNSQQVRIASARLRRIERG